MEIWRYFIGSKDGGVKLAVHFDFKRQYEIPRVEKFAELSLTVELFGNLHLHQLYDF